MTKDMSRVERLWTESMVWIAHNAVDILLASAVAAGIVLALGFSVLMSLSGLGWLPQGMSEGIRSHFDGYYTGVIGHIIMFCAAYVIATAFPRRQRDLTNLTVWTQAVAVPGEEDSGTD